MTERGRERKGGWRESVILKKREKERRRMDERGLRGNAANTGQGVSNDSISG